MKLEEQLRLLGWAIKPERGLVQHPVLFNDHAQQVVEATFWVPLDVEIDPCRAGGQLRVTEDMDFLFPNRQSLQSVLVELSLLFGLLGLLAGPEGAGQLGDREDT